MRKQLMNSPTDNDIVTVATMSRNFFPTTVIIYGKEETEGDKVRAYEQQHPTTVTVDINRPKDF